jgi:hypothetical protein
MTRLAASRMSPARSLENPYSTRTEWGYAVAARGGAGWARLGVCFSPCKSRFSAERRAGSRCCMNDGGREYVLGPDIVSGNGSWNRYDIASIRGSVGNGCGRRTNRGSRQPVSCPNSRNASAPRRHIEVDPDQIQSRTGSFCRSDRRIVADGFGTCQRRFSSS